MTGDARNGSGLSMPTTTHHTYLPVNAGAARFATWITLFIMPGTASLAVERAIHKEVRVEAPVDAVWRAWTTTEGVKSFLAPDAHVEARVLGPFRIYFNPFAPAGQKGEDDGMFLALQDRRMLSFTWSAPPHLPEARAQRTYVTVRLQELGESATQVHVYHGGWGDGGEWEDAYAYFDRAWVQVLASLQKRFASGQPMDWTPYLERLREAADQTNESR
jgi:uncharacterized protein YndB with AHSA1/START domain